MLSVKQLLIKFDHFLEARAEIGDIFSGFFLKGIEDKKEKSF